MSTIAEVNRAIDTYFARQGVRREPATAADGRGQAHVLPKAADYPLPERLAYLFDPVRCRGTIVWRGEHVRDVTEFRATEAGVRVVTADGASRFFCGADADPGLAATSEDRAMSRSELAKAAADVAAYLAAADSV